MTKREFFIPGVNHLRNQFDGFCIEASRPYFTKRIINEMMDVVDFISYDETNDVYIIQEEEYEDPKFSFKVNPVDVFEYGTKIDTLYSLPIRFDMKQQMTKEQILSWDKYLNLGIETFYQKLKVKFFNYKLTTIDINEILFEYGEFQDVDFTNYPFICKTQIEGTIKNHLMLKLSWAYFNMTTCDSNSYAEHFPCDAISCILYEQYQDAKDVKFISRIIDDYYDTCWTPYIGTTLFDQMIADY